MPHSVTEDAPDAFASAYFRMSAGMTWDEEGSKLSCGPYMLTSSRWMAHSPNSSRHACPCTSSIFFDRPYGALVSSGYPSHSASSRNGTGVSLGYEQTVPMPTNLSTPERAA